ncbi:MAG: hypothetical protein FWC50_08130 [Planctomycetaceae bacterium]|nr:hypothetical protein [Planctomycetaceae bacterium]
MLRNHNHTISRTGLTLVEILVSLTLMLMIMLALVQMFRSVGTTINETQTAVLVSSRLRSAVLTIEDDLKHALPNSKRPLQPPFRAEDSPGYLCIVEGLGSYYGNPKKNPDNPHETNDPNKPQTWTGWDGKDIAINSDNGNNDSTIGDMDDIISFTAHAPVNAKFRGLVGGKMEESEDAEICLFVRGTTLYRRVLLIYPDDKLQKVLEDKYKYDKSKPDQPREFLFGAHRGYGFYNDFDVSVHLDANGYVRANTLADLTRRENRFGNWNFNAAPNQFSFPYGLHNSAVWYQLRLPTLSDCTMNEPDLQDNSKIWRWRAGDNLYTKNLGDFLTYDNTLYPVDVLQWRSADWQGQKTSFPFPFQDPNQPDAPRSYIDFWKAPFPWKNTVSKEGGAKGALTTSAVDISNKNDTRNIFALCANGEYSTVTAQRDSDDVLLTNVIGFDVKVWDSVSKSYIDLGSEHNRTITTYGFNDRAKYPASMGNYCYGHDKHGDVLPSVYDTWTDAYENEAPAGIDGLGVNGNVTNIYDRLSDWKYPPPYSAPLEGVQIKIRVMDPSSPRGIREMTIQSSFK